MSRLRVHCFAISQDGYGAGPNQSIHQPLGAGGTALHEWAFNTRTFKHMLGQEGGAQGIDDNYMVRGGTNIGAWIIGRNTFGPIRGPWPDESWQGWWGSSPPYRCPVFVLTHHARPSLAMSGGTVFHFVTDGIMAAYERAMDAADGRDVRLGGGVSTIRQYLQARLIDELHIATAAVTLGAGESLLAGLDPPRLGYEYKEHVQTLGATHVVLKRRRAA
jgi:dihydrofolate reductase